MNKSFVPQFVTTIPAPSAMKQGVVYVSLRYSTVSHLCMCGCGVETVTPLVKDIGWNLHFTSPTVVSLQPSIGNQNLPCRSHYVLTENRVEWC